MTTPLERAAEAHWEKAQDWSCYEITLFKEWPKRTRKHWIKQMRAGFMAALDRDEIAKVIGDTFEAAYGVRDKKTSLNAADALIGHLLLEMPPISNE